MFKQAVFITILFLTLCTNPTHANDIYLPAISVDAYQNALKTGGNVVFRNTKVPDELKEKVQKIYGSRLETNPNDNQDISQRIILGSNASRGEYPEFTLVLVENNGSLFPYCGATLIDDRKILTAAHCADLPNRYYSIPNFYAFSDYSSGIPSSQLFPVSSKRIHPNYTETATRLDHDIAVFTLTKSASTRTAVLHDLPESLAGAAGTVIGVGLLSSQTQTTPNILQEVSAPIVSNAACQATWGNGIQITSTIICAGFRNSDRGSCNGDSGGPLWSTIEGKRTQVGVVSFGPTNCSNNSEVYSGYARVQALASFIKQQAPGARFSSDITTNISPVYMLLLD